MLLPKDAPEWELLRIHVDLYKHHFDLFVKGYVVYLAIIGTVASFVFRPETGPLTRALLLGLAVLMSALATVAWITGIVWSDAFRKEIRDICGRLGDLQIPMFGVKIMLTLGVLGSFSITLCGVYLMVWQ